MEEELDDLDEDELQKLQDRINKRLEKKPTPTRSASTTTVPKQSNGSPQSATSPTSTTGVKKSKSMLQPSTSPKSTTNPNNAESIEDMRKQLAELQVLDDQLRGLKTAAKTERPSSSTSTKKSSTLPSRRQKSVVVPQQQEEDDDQDADHEQDEEEDEFEHPKPKSTKTSAITKKVAKKPAASEIFDTDTEPETTPQQQTPTPNKTDSNGSTSKKKKSTTTPISSPTHQNTFSPSSSKSTPAKEETLLSIPKAMNTPSPLMSTPTGSSNSSTPQYATSISKPIILNRNVVNNYDQQEEEEDEEELKPKPKAKKSSSSTSSSGGSISKKTKGSLTKKAGNQIASVTAKPDPLPENSYKALVMFNYKAKHNDELSIFRNDIVTVVFEKNADWYRVRMGSNEGLVPAKFVQKLDSSKLFWCFCFDIFCCLKQIFDFDFGFCSHVFR